MYKREVLLEDLASEIRKVARDNPDYVYRDHYTNCSYVEEVETDKYQPLCIVGHALVNLGIEPARLDRDAEFEEIYEDFIIAGDAIDVDSPEIQWIQTVQISQDSYSVSWSAAIKKADEFKEKFWPN